MFLPSEAVMPRSICSFQSWSRKAGESVSIWQGPDNLMLLLHTVRAILRDARMHEAAGLIQAEVDTMMQDVGQAG
jgi:DNA recombination protein RmuC